MLRRIDEGEKLGLHDFVAGQGFGGIDLVKVRLLRGTTPQKLNSVACQGMALKEREAPRLGEHLLIAEIVEKLDQPTRGKTGPFQIGDGGLVGSGLLSSGIGEGPKLAKVFRAAQERNACVRRARRGRQYAKPKADQKGLHCRLFHFTRSDRMATGGMAGFVGDDADQLVRIGGFGDQARINADQLAVHGDGVQFLIADEQDGDILRVQACSDKDGVGVGVQGLFNLGVTKEADASVLRSDRGLHCYQANR